LGKVTPINASIKARLLDLQHHGKLSSPAGIGPAGQVSEAHPIARIASHVTQNEQCYFARPM
jgi:hypothetical protein